MTKHMHMRHMYISIAAVTVRLLIMAVLLSSLFPDYLRDEGIIAPRSRFVNSFFENILSPAFENAPHGKPANERRNNKAVF